MPSNPPARAAHCSVRPQPTRQPADSPFHPRAGITLVEMLVSVGLTILLMSILAQVFTLVAGTVSLERTLREVDQRVRSAQAILRSDLEGVTAVMNPPRDPADGEGYFEYEENTTVVEWDAWRGSFVTSDGIDNDRDGATDEADEAFLAYTGVDTDDVIQFTTRIGRGRQRPFVGRGAGGQVETQAAEVAYFLRESRPRTGTTPVVYNLYRRQLLVDADQPTFIYDNDGDTANDASWYWQYDLSARPNRPGISLTSPGHVPNGIPVVNRLGDLTLRANRFAHDPLWTPNALRWPQLPISFDDVDGDGLYDPDDVNLAPLRITWFGRPLLRETADVDWDSPIIYPSATTPYLAPVDANNDGLLDGFETPLPAPTGVPVPNERSRFAEDVLLTNVLSFNVEAWDPGAPIFEQITATGRIRFDPSHPSYTLVPDNPGNAVGNIPIVSYGAYVDLGYGLPNWVQTSGNLRFIDTFFPTRPVFWTNGDIRSALIRTYDTWANYGNDGFDNDYNLVPAFPPNPSVFEGNSPIDPVSNRRVANEIDDDIDFLIDEGIDDGFNGVDDDGDQGYWQSNGLDDDGDGLFDLNDPDEGIDETYVSAGPGWADGIDNDVGIDPALVGVDNEEELLEAETPPPYPVPLQGIRIRIRVIEPASQQTREFTLIQSFRTE